MHPIWLAAARPSNRVRMWRSDGPDVRTQLQTWRAEDHSAQRGARHDCRVHARGRLLGSRHRARGDASGRRVQISRQRQAFFDVKVISPFAKSNLKQSPTQMFKTAEQQKIREYGERIKEVERADFTPFVFICTGVMAPKCHLVTGREDERAPHHAAQCTSNPQQESPVRQQHRARCCSCKDGSFD